MTITRPGKEQKAPRRAGIRRLVFVLAGVGLVLVAALLLWPGRDTLTRHRGRWEAIVELARKEPVSPGTRVDYRLEPSWDLSTWRRVADGEYVPRSNEVGLVAVSRDPTGRLQVEIITSSWGHGGKWGLLYSEVPVSAHGRYRLHDGPGLVPQLGRRRDERWWDVYSGLE